jgi:predicted amidohydrolase
VGQICDALDGSGMRSGIASLIAARSIDARVGRAFVDAFRASSGARLKPGDPVPIVRFPSDRLPQQEQDDILAKLGKRTGDPRIKAERLDRTDHLRLAPEAVGQLRVRHIWVDPWLEAIGPNTQFVVGVTNDAAFDTDFSWKSYVVGAQHCFYGVVPKRVEEQQGRIARVIARAVEIRATIVVLPELSMTPTILESLTDQGLLADLPFVVAGSFHTPTAPEAPGRNVCEVLGHGERLFSHDKFSDFHYEARGARWHEHLDRNDGTSGFDLLLAANCTAVVLICKDTFGEIRSLVKDLAPTLLLVPAMSEDTSEFELLAKDLAYDPQSFTVVACAGPGHNVIYGRPTLKNPVITGLYTADSVVTLGLSGIAHEGKPRVN